MTTLRSIAKWLAMASASIVMIVAANAALWVVMLAASLTETTAIAAHLLSACVLLMVAVVAWRGDQAR